ncbi:putative HIT domain-containing protein [Rosellinia necatrix]|uniref:Putative HIT domain-containing protein n=1 Tax=Rosellinia necatrix TaxID=77044 RepID=A0A1W2TT83_ROSNE|nr:putative HIT domain-containing protein [Rosellinia necatrix]
MAEPPPPFDPTAADNDDDGCPFCGIAAAYAPFPARRPPAAGSAAVDPGRVAPAPASYVVLSTRRVVAFLDIMPLSRGHLLLCPRRHRAKLSDVTPREAARLGAWLRVLSRALARATGVHDWNVVQNNGAAAAQVVAHVHYHLIPRPEIRASGRLRESFTMFGRGRREDLDDDDAALLAARLRADIAAVLLEEEEEEEEEEEGGDDDDDDDEEEEEKGKGGGEGEGEKGVREVARKAKL